MKTKDKVLELLKEHSGEYLSGQEIADSLYVTRACVWKCIKALENDGHSIDAVTNRGYRLKLSPDSIDSDYISAELKKNSVNAEILYYDQVTSTNDIASDYGRRHTSNAVIIANSQTEGRGRRGRSFYSPGDSGLYMSIVIKPCLAIDKSVGITAMAACAVSRAIDSCLGLKDELTKIKWVNDIFYKGKKVCGILTQAHSSLEDETDGYIVVGIGINVFCPQDDFPKDIKDVAGYLIHGSVEENENIRNRLCAAIVCNLFDYYLGENQNQRKIIDYYREKSMLTDSYVRINSFSKDIKYAKVKGITDDYHLLVEYDNGSVEELSTGEVSVVKY